MGKAEKERLNQMLIEHLNTIHETFQVLAQSPPSSLDKVSWNDVVKIGEQLYKQATTVGMLWTGEGPEAKALEESMATYSNLLQGFLLLSHGSMIGVGPTLSSCIHSSVKQVVDCSFMLLKESVSSYGNTSKVHKLSIPQLVGTVWESCSALKKTPATNTTAIGRSLTQVALSLKDVLREMNELKPADVDVANVDDVHVSDTSSHEGEEELGTDLSPQEMKITKLTINVVQETLSTIKELIRSITGLLKNPQTENENNEIVSSLERLLTISKSLGVQVDEMGACLYPPQEVSAIKGGLEKMGSLVGEIKVELGIIGGLSEGFVNASDGLMGCLKALDLELEGCFDDEIEGEMKDLVIE